MNTFCTIITGNYIPYALALYESLSEFDSEVILHVLISDTEELDVSNFPTNVRIQFYTEICNSGVAISILEKYHIEAHDKFRWSMKPVFLNYLLDTYEKAIYVDCDIQFTNNSDFLFEHLNEYNILLSPHFRSSDPLKDRSNFFMQFFSGIYNGGFFGANKGAKGALDWWAKACDYICLKDPCSGQFDDQTHLNLIPVFFDKVYLLKHRGCNVANWNQVECKRTLTGNGELKINGKWPVVFTHFTRSTIRGILKGDDPHLLPYLESYNARLMKFGITESLLDMDLNDASARISLIRRIKRKIHLMTKD